jgi:hypothetical protein
MLWHTVYTGTWVVSCEESAWLQGSDTQRVVVREGEKHAAVSTAIEMYRARDLAFWLPETEAALAQVDA